MDGYGSYLFLIGSHRRYAQIKDRQSTVTFRPSFPRPRSLDCSTLWTFLLPLTLITRRLTRGSTPILSYPKTARVLQPPISILCSTAYVSERCYNCILCIGTSPSATGNRRPASPGTNGTRESESPGYINSTLSTHDHMSSDIGIDLEVCDISKRSTREGCPSI